MLNYFLAHVCDLKPFYTQNSCLSLILLKFIAFQTQGNRKERLKIAEYVRDVSR